MNINALKKEPNSFKINLIYSRLVELTEGEEDPEACEYNEFLLDALQDLRHYCIVHEEREANYGKKF